MRKNGLIETLIVLIGGALGYSLRIREINEVFEEATGLAREGAPVTMSLIALSAAMCALFFVLSFFVKKRPLADFNEAFGYKNLFVSLLLCMCGGAMIVITGHTLMISNMPFREMIWCVLMVLSGCAIVFMGLKTVRGRNRNGPALATMIPVVALCTWLIFSYIDRAADPVLLKYTGEFFALAFTIMGFYYVSGFAFGKMRVRSTLACSRIAVYFIIVHLADDMTFSRQVVYIALAVSLIILSCLLQKNTNTKSPAEPIEVELEEPENLSGDDYFS